MTRWIPACCHLAFGVGLLGGLIGCTAPVGTQSGGAVPIDPDDIGGVVTGPAGPEAGVWVIAETASLPTPFARIVVTDEQGRYVLPDLPRGDYQVWVRGYGLVDAPRRAARPGQQLNLTAVAAPTPAAAAEYYPAAYWLAMMEQPVGQCGLACHQIGNKATREIPASILEKSRSTLHAWQLRMAAGVEGASMAAAWSRFSAEEQQAWVEWTDRVARGEIPRQTPRRPTGVERNLVVSLWDWGTKFDGRTDAVASDLRDARVNAGGLVYMVSRSNDVMTTLDPDEHRVQVHTVPSNAPEKRTNTPWSAYWGDEPVWKRRAEPRSLAMDRQARVWFSAMVRGDEQPAFCTSPDNRFARFFPIESAGGGARQAMLYEPGTARFTPIGDVCASLDHNQFGPDDYWYFGSRDVVWWLDTPKFLDTKDAEASQGWCPAVVDTNADGVITEWTEPDQPTDPAKDRRVSIGCYQVAVDHNDPNGVAWCGDAGRLTRIEKGPSPPQSCRAQVFVPPKTGSEPEVSGAAEATVDDAGVVWVNWRGSQHFTSFDYRKCTTTNGPGAATGELCREGWTLYRRGGPAYGNGSTAVEADLTYLPQVDLHDALGLGRGVPMYGTVNANMNVALLSEARQFVELNVPYPMGFFSRSSNGRIDNPATGWKGRGVWSSFSNYALWHMEGIGTEGNGSKAVKFQMRPDPLAK
ncbi:MAG: carboxypeptidase regulatory-like domain-containing protein [Acidimicrobiia bacterium]|nr:carboxypeptidase regulatory-like domain-containing protein [Acidimicrobiia bacterium]